MATFEELLGKRNPESGYSSLDDLLGKRRPESGYSSFDDLYAEAPADDVADTTAARSVKTENAGQTAARSNRSYCRIVKAACSAQCSETSLPSGNFGGRFFNCVNDCMKANGCDPFAYYLSSKD